MTTVKKRPALLRALGQSDPPEHVSIRGSVYDRINILKHDSWAATAIYATPSGERAICKFNRTQSVFGIPMRWLGRILATREAGFLKRLADIELVPDDLGHVTADGRVLPNAIARAYVDGEAFTVKEQINAKFFEELRTLLAAVHAHDMAYVDLHKRENIIVSLDCRPYLIDFQVSLGLSQSWLGRSGLARFIVAKLQEMDIYHFNKHLTRCLPETLTPEQLAEFQQLPALVRYHRKIAAPLRSVRRALLVRMKVRQGEGLASSELEAEDAFRRQAK
jgi:hypothetical protein